MRALLRPFVHGLTFRTARPPLNNHRRVPSVRPKGQERGLPGGQDWYAYPYAIAAAGDRGVRSLPAPADGCLDGTAGARATLRGRAAERRPNAAPVADTCRPARRDPEPGTGASPPKGRVQRSRASRQPLLDGRETSLHVALEAEVAARLSPSRAGNRAQDSVGLASRGPRIRPADVSVQGITSPRVVRVVRDLLFALPAERGPLPLVRPNTFPGRHGFRVPRRRDRADKPTTWQVPPAHHAGSSPGSSTSLRNGGIGVSTGAVRSRSAHRTTTPHRDRQRDTRCRFAQRPQDRGESFALARGHVERRRLDPGQAGVPRRASACLAVPSEPGRSVFTAKPGRGPITGVPRPTATASAPGGPVRGTTRCS